MPSDSQSLCQRTHKWAPKTKDDVGGGELHQLPSDSQSWCQRAPKIPEDVQVAGQQQQASAQPGLVPPSTQALPRTTHEDVGVELSPQQADRAWCHQASKPSPGLPMKMSELSFRPSKPIYNW
eukprot:CAMPEP_0177688072 /NCGR_PEP_ID=MMETSP0447-20121125/34468_1 /TAXON_ID=0 /ORGANISM="Stygamoeba regulata, Strain BSH-02190019" /LENGTH=122 /DNA_ID=CAMNT_0019198359 /DNA_START=120 /DNA_END=485 /DNA_ORIENTATION=-